MKRKLIGLARSTHVITLPNAWLDAHSIVKGDELEVHEFEHSIIIQPSKHTKVLSVDISGLDWHAKRFLNCCYKAGYDLIHIAYKTDIERQAIEEGVHDYLIGLEITNINEETKTITVQSIGTVDASGFPTMLKRIFFILKQNIDELGSSYSERNSIIGRDKEINKYADYCRRILSMNTLKPLGLGFKRNAPLYSIVEQLEKIGDDIRDLAKSASHIPEEFTDVKEYFADLYQLFYSFSPELFKEFVEKRYVLQDKFNQVLKAKPRRSLLYCHTIIEKIFDLNGPITVLYL